MTRNELIDEIIDLKVTLRKATIPEGHCPYAYYTDIKQIGECENCTTCKQLFFELYKEKLEKHFVTEREENK